MQASVSKGREYNYEPSIRVQHLRVNPIFNGRGGWFKGAPLGLARARGLISPKLI